MERIAASSPVRHLPTLLSLSCCGGPVSVSITSRGWLCLDISLVSPGWACDNFPCHNSITCHRSPAGRTITPALFSLCWIHQNLPLLDDFSSFSLINHTQGCPMKGNSQCSKWKGKIKKKKNIFLSERTRTYLEMDWGVSNLKCISPAFHSLPTFQWVEITIFLQ